MKRYWERAFEFEYMGSIVTLFLRAKPVFSTQALNEHRQTEKAEAVNN